MSDDIFGNLNDNIAKAIEALPPEQRAAAAKDLGQDFHRITSKIANYAQQNDFQRREQVFTTWFNDWTAQHGYRPSLEIQWAKKQELGLNGD